MQTVYSPDLLVNIDETGINLSFRNENKVVKLDVEDLKKVQSPNRIGNITLLFTICANGSSLPPAVLWPSKTLFPEVEEVLSFLLLQIFLLLQEVFIL
jgi:hypothetical protein